jgi:Homeodomain-like domain
MPMAQLIITTVTVEGRTKSEVARDYGVSRYWVQQLVQRYQREGRLPSSRGPGGRITARAPSTPTPRMSSFGCVRSCLSRAWTRRGNHCRPPGASEHGRRRHGNESQPDHLAALANFALSRRATALFTDSSPKAVGAGCPFRPSTAAPPARATADTNHWRWQPLARGLELQRPAGRTVRWRCRPAWSLSA